jgi:hypothetical protein
MAVPSENPAPDKSPPQKLLHGQTIPPNTFISAGPGISIKHFVAISPKARRYHLCIQEQHNEKIMLFP